MTNCLYFLSNHLAEEANILETGQDDKGHFIICDQTIFHAQGGGQKSDRGSIDGIEVLSVNKRGTPQEFEVMHYLATPLTKQSGGQVSMQVDASARKLHTHLHSLGHLIAHVIDEACPVFKAVQGHHWPDECRVEFEVASDAAPPPDLAHVNELLAAAIAADLPLISQLAPDHGRTVQIGEWAPVPCGGTHVKSMGELAAGTVKSVKIKGARARVSYE